MSENPLLRLPSASAAIARDHAVRAEAPTGAPRLGVLVPCRNESAVIERKLRNLARLDWPAGAHRIVVVDDGSQDGSADLAARACAELFDAQRARVVRNDERPGKGGALRQGLACLEGECELVVLTDADVVLDPAALSELAAAFEREPALGMACGAQVFVRSLAADGSLRDAELAPLVESSAAWDRFTARVRRRESRRGRLFSVHGQLLAWRAELGLRPLEGVAADDLDLLLQLRERHRGRSVRVVESARFFERKPLAPEAIEAQALRRARAYVQVFRAHPEPPRGSRIQYLAYRHLPFAAPWLALGLALAAPFHAGVFLGAPAALATVAALVLAARTRTGRELVALLETIVRAERLEAHEPMPERWDMERT